MKNFFFTLIFIITTIGSSQSQNIYLRAQFGYHNFNMKQLKSVQNKIIEDFKSRDIEATTTDDFSSYTNSQLQLLFSINERINMGIFYDFSSTGGRIYYQDYSGKYELNQYLKQSSIGLQGEKYFQIDNYINNYFFIIIRGFMLFSTLKSDETILLSGKEYCESTTFLSRSFGIEPGIRWEYYISQLSIGVETCYKYHSDNEFYLKGNKNKNMIIDGKKIAPNWNGFIIKFSLGIKL